MRDGIGGQEHRGTLDLHVWTSDPWPATPIAELFRGIGYAVRSAGTGTPDPKTPSAALAVVGADTGSLHERASDLRRRYGDAVGLACLALAGPTREAELALRAARIAVAEAADEPATSFRRIAAALGIDIRADVFVSYARLDATIADDLFARLQERGLRPWFDRRDLMPSDLWRQVLTQGIATSDSFLFLGSGRSVASKNCREELGWAEDFGKRIVGLLIEDLPAASLPEAIGRRQFIASPVADGSRLGEAACDEVAEALRRDPRLVRLHRDLLARAIDYQATGSPDKLLRGRELREAEAWLLETRTRDREPRPVVLHSKLIAASQIASRRRAWRTGMIASAVTALTIGLTIWAVLNSIRADTERAAAQSRLAEQRAFGAYMDWDSDPTKAFLEADSAARLAPAGEAVRIAYARMAASLAGRMPVAVVNLETEVVAAAFSPSLARVAILPILGEPSVYPLAEAAGGPVALHGQPAGMRFDEFRFSADETLVAGLGRDRFAKRTDPYEAVVWNAVTGERIASVTLDFVDPGAALSVLGFTGDGRHVVVTTARGSSDFLAYVIGIEGPAGRLVRPPWRSATGFRFGPIDLASGVVAEVGPSPEGGSRIALRDLVSGRPAFSWSPLQSPDTVRQATLASGAAALVLNGAQGDASSARLSVFRLTPAGAVPAGPPVVGPGPIHVWRTSRDGAVSAVSNAGADFPSELWLAADGRRISIPGEGVGKLVFIANRGEEFRSVDLVADDRIVLTRTQHDAQTQQLLALDPETMRLLAAPFVLPFGYRGIGISGRGAALATVSPSGLVQRWDLLREAQPRGLTLPLAGPTLRAAFLRGASLLMTISRETLDRGYAKRLDLWDAGTGRRVGGLNDGLDIKAETAIATGGTQVATAGPTPDGPRLTLWDATIGAVLWRVPIDAMPDEIAFADGDRRLRTIGTDAGGVPRLTDYDAASAAATAQAGVVKAGSTHLAFSADGNAVVADYDYDTILVRDVVSGRTSAPITFNDAVGLPFDIGYDIIRSLRSIVLDEKGLTGDLPGGVHVRLQSDGLGTAIVPAGDRTPILSAYQRGSERLYPVRGSDLVSPDGRWFALASNTSAVDRATSLRVYDLRSGFPVSGPLTHEFRGGPKRPWPTILSRDMTEHDPIVALAYAGQGDDLLTLTTSGVLRCWSIGDRGWSRMAPDDADPAAAQTGRQLVSARYVRRLPRSEYVASVAAVARTPGLADRLADASLGCRSAPAPR